jgi:hypothetical protein
MLHMYIGAQTDGKKDNTYNLTLFIPDGLALFGGIVELRIFIEREREREQIKIYGWSCKKVGRKFYGQKSDIY